MKKENISIYGVMSSLSLLLNLADELDCLSNRVLADDFGFGIYPYQLNRIYRPRYRQSLPARINTKSEYPLGRNTDTSVSTVGKDGFQVCMDVQQFKPSELCVKTVDDFIVVEGRHEERQDDHGLVSRHFVRKYCLPKGYDPSQVVSTLSSDGILTVKVPLPQKLDESKERIIQIQQTGPAHLSVKENPKVDASGDGENPTE